MKLQIILSLLLILVTGCTEIDTVQTPSYEKPKTQIQQDEKVESETAADFFDQLEGLSAEEVEEVIASIVEKIVETKSESAVETFLKEVEVVALEPIQKNVKESESIIKQLTNSNTNCHPSYSGCLKINAGDYDCAGGSGNGLNYTGQDCADRYERNKVTNR